MIDKNEEELDDFEHHAAVDIPDINAIRNGNADEWVNVETFVSKQEAIDWAKKHLNADNNGMICVISTF